MNLVGITEFKTLPMHMPVHVCHFCTPGFDRFGIELLEDFTCVKNHSLPYFF